MSSPTASRLPTQLVWGTVLLAVALATPAAGADDVNQTEVKLHKDIYTVQGVELAPLYIGDPNI